jgi:hypothetical protein
MSCCCVGFALVAVSRLPRISRAGRTHSPCLWPFMAGNAAGKVASGSPFDDARYRAVHRPHHFHNEGHRTYGAEMEWGRMPQSNGFALGSSRSCEFAGHTQTMPKTCLPFARSGELAKWSKVSGDGGLAAAITKRIPVPSTGARTRLASKLLKEVVGASGFEPPASWSRTRRSTRLSHAPILPV